MGEHHLRFVPRGVADTIEADNVAPGAMTSLQNLLHDPATPGCFICRPANTKLIDFTAWGAAPGTTDVITAAYQVGNIIFGLVGITSGAYAGLDYPFAYNTATAAFLAVTGVTVPKTPTSQASTGAWTPPQMTLTGVNLVVTHTGFAGAGKYFGWFDLTTPTAPVWNAGDTATNSLGAVPSACGTFNNRTRFVIKNVIWYTDTLALTMTNANQSQTYGDYTSILALAPLPTSSTALNIAQGLLAYKLNSVALITGDPTGGTLALNELSSSVGTAAPRSVVSTPDGVRFMATDGIRNISFFGQVSEPDMDLAIPFINAVTPSRVAAAFNADIYRICTQNNVVSGTPYQDYWYSFKRHAWSGPHTFRYDVAVPLGNDFALASNSIAQAMWKSFSVQAHAGAGNTFVENGTQLMFAYITPPMTDLENIYANCVIRSTIELAAAASGQTYNFTAQDENGSALATGSISEPDIGAKWNSFKWGAAKWGDPQSGLLPITIPWNQAVVFNRLSVIGAGPSSLAVRIGSLHNAYKRLNYLLN